MKFFQKVLFIIVAFFALEKLTCTHKYKNKKPTSLNLKKERNKSTCDIVGEYTAKTASFITICTVMILYQLFIWKELGLNLEPDCNVN